MGRENGSHSIGADKGVRGGVYERRHSAERARHAPVKVFGSVLLRYAGFALHLFGGVVGDQRVDRGLQQTLHHHREVVVGEADAVVGEAVLGEVVGAAFFDAVAGADLLLALLGLTLVDALGFDFVEARAQDAHRLFAVLDLRLFVLAAYDRVGGKVRDADCRVGRIHRLPTRT